MSFKLVPWIVGGLALLGVAWVVNGWRMDSNRLPLVEKNLEDQKATFNKFREGVAQVHAASQGFQDELARLRNSRAIQPTAPVRLCRTAPAAGVPLPTTQPGPDGAAATGGVVPEAAGGDPGAGPDIGPELRALADRADEVSAQARGLQHQASGLAK